jgi:hypothetical protein
MKLKIYFIALFAIALVFTECKKKKKNDTVTPGTTIYTDVCTGNSANTQYIPLSVGNTWTYSGALLPVTSTVTKDTVAFGKTYFVASYTPAGVLPKSYQRYNSSGDLVALDSLPQGKSHEAILIPSNTAVTGTPFAISAQGTSTIIANNVSMSLSSGCHYDGLLEIQVTTNTTTTYYYKKGIGLVHLTCADGTGTCAFSSVVLSSMSIH